MDHIETFKLFKREIDALSYALWLINWDSETEMPLGSQAFKASQTAVLNEKLIELYLNPNRTKAIEELNISMKKLHMEDMERDSRKADVNQKIVRMFFAATF